MTNRIWYGIASLLLLTACDHAPAAATNTDAPGKEVRISALPPTKQSVIRAVLASSDVLLTGHSFCSPYLPRETLGEYMSKLFAELEDAGTPPDAKNSVRVEIDKMNLEQYLFFFSDQPAPAGADLETEIGWHAKVIVHQSAGEILWGYGVDFFIHQDGLVESTSFRCIGTP